MKKIKLFLFAIILNLFFIGNIIAQISYGGKPYSFNNNYSSVLKQEVPTITMEPVNVSLLQAEDIVNDQNKEIPWRFGKNIDVNITLFTAGQWEYLPNGDKLWRLRVYSQGAYTLNFGFNKYNLPSGASLFLYNESHTEVLGSFTSLNNVASQQFATTLIPGDAITLEYYEPADAQFSGEIVINRVTHGYRNVFDFATKGFGGAGSCQRNVACSESAGWEQQIRSVCMLVVGGSGFCTGALINNAANNATPYVLTANHCSTSNDFAQWVFWFNWQSATCTNPGTAPAHNQVTTSGSVLKARNGGSDFCLVQMNQTPPCTFNPYYSGWSRSTTPATSACGIHHPSVDIKKISFSTQAAISASYSGVDSWQILWGTTCTEPGSSGSPIYDQNHRIIGQLYGGPSACGAIPSSMNDYYGKVSTSWAGGGTSATRLSDWLDPLGTAPQFIDGYDPCLLNPPVANFSANTTSSCSGIIQFTDLSTNSPTSWLWDFGDGQTSTAQNPQHIYTSNGTFTVSLTATNSIGSDQFINTNYITINMPSVPDVTSGINCGAGTVNLSASGSGVIHWFNAPSAGTDLGNGPTFTTPSISSTTTYYVEDHIVQPSQYVGPLSNFGAGSYSTTAYTLNFDCLAACTLVSVAVDKQNAGNVTIQLTTSTGTILQSGVFAIPAGASRVTLNWPLSIATGLKLVGQANVGLWRVNTGGTFPYTLAGLVSITSCSSGTRFGSFFDWEIKEPDCISSRVPVVATILNIVTPSLTISTGNTTICQGDTITFTANPINGGMLPQYQWQLNGNNVGPNNSNVTTSAINNNDIITCTLTSSESCVTSSTATSNSITMTVNPLAIAGFTFISNQLDYTFTNTSTNATSYLWDFGDGTTSTLQNPVHTYALEGNYTVTLTVNNSCGSNLSTQSITVTNIETNNAHININVYPNPAKNNVMLDVTGLTSNEMSVKIIDVLGRPVFIEKFSNLNSNSKINLDLSNFEKGIYLMNVNVNNETKLLKLVHE